MRYSEFKRDIEAMGLSVITYNGCVEVWDEYDDVLLYVDTEYDFSISTDLLKFNELDKDNKKELFYLAVELASTPLQEREDEKRYRLKIPFLGEDISYLNLNEEERYYSISNKINKGRYKTIFTESEITELKRKYNLDSFVLEEVKEDE